MQKNAVKPELFMNHKRAAFSWSKRYVQKTVCFRQDDRKSRVGLEVRRIPDHS